MFAIDGKVIAVTGGRRGLGRAIGAHLAAAGARVALLDVVDPAETAGETGALGLVCDVRDRDQVATAFDAIEAALGPLQGLVNNAAAYSDAESLEEFHRVFDTNVFGALTCSLQAAERMAPGGSIVNIGSYVAANHGVTDDYTIYIASKAAQLSVARSLAIQLGPRGVRVNSVSPGPVPTPDGQYGPEYLRVHAAFTPAGLPEDAREVAAAVHYFLSDATRHISGANLIADGAFSQGYSVKVVETVFGAV